MGKRYATPLSVRPSGFALLELLVVLSIIGLLVGILIPTLAKARQMAIKSTCASNLRQIGAAIRIYQGDFDNRFPLARYMPAPFISMFPDDPGLTRTLESQIDSTNKVYRCGGDTGYVYDVAGISYTYNASLSGRELDETWFARRLRLDPTKTPVAYDCDGNTFLLDGGGEITVPPFHTSRNLLFADSHVGNY